MRIIVTGSNSGVGKATAAALVAAGHDVVIACRTVAKGEKVAAQMARSGAGTVGVCHLDLADLTSVRKFAGSVESVDVLVNNAGVLGLPLSRPRTGSRCTWEPTIWAILRSPVYWATASPTG